MTLNPNAAANRAHIQSILDTMLDRMERVVAAIVRRYPPPAYHRHCPKAACRRARRCRAGTGAYVDACLGRLSAQASRSQGQQWS